MLVWIERLTGGINSFHAKLRQIVHKLFVNQLKSLSVVFVLRFAVRGQGMLETVDDGNQRLNQPGSGPLAVFRTFPFNALAIVVKIRLPPKEGLPQILQICRKFCHIRVRPRIVRGHRVSFRCFALFRFRVVSFACHRQFPFQFARPYYIFPSASPKSSATYATALIARSYCMRVGPRIPSEPWAMSPRVYGALIIARFSPASDISLMPICTSTGSGESMHAFSTLTSRCFSSMASSNSFICDWLENSGAPTICAVPSTYICLAGPSSSVAGSQSVRAL